MDWFEINTSLKSTMVKYRLVKMDKHSFITLNNTGIIQYNIHNNKWIDLIPYPPDFKVQWRTFIAFGANMNQQALYIYICSDDKVMKYNFTEKKWTISAVGGNHKSSGRDPKGIILNDTFNIIGNSKHLIWHDKNNKFEQIHEFMEHPSGYFLSHDVVHIKSKRMVLLFGGSDSNNNKLDVIYTYKYDVEQPKWCKLAAKMPKRIVNFGVSSILNGKYILLFGGFGNDGYHDDIYVFSYATKIFSKSKVKCPKKAIFKAITMCNDEKDELIVFGYIRKQWNICKVSMDKFPPFYLMKLIQTWYWNAITYLIDKNGNHCHWKIDTLDLL